MCELLPLVQRGKQSGYLLPQASPTSPSPSRSQSLSCWGQLQGLCSHRPSCAFPIEERGCRGPADWETSALSEAQAAHHQAMLPPLASSPATLSASGIPRTQAAPRAKVIVSWLPRSWNRSPCSPGWTSPLPCEGAAFQDAKGRKEEALELGGIDWSRSGGAGGLVIVGPYV